jgi:hypothetical protein
MQDVTHSHDSRLGLNTVAAFACSEHDDLLRPHIGVKPWLGWNDGRSSGSCELKCSIWLLNRDHRKVTVAAHMKSEGN